jgi:enamine deaminase RidA (YjgF/YER057c/UK114 family)
MNMEQRTNINSGSPWEPVVGYSRAVRVGRHIWVSGTTAVDEEGKITSVNDAAGQTRQILNIIRKSLEKSGAKLNHIVRTRIFVRDIRQWEEIGQVHAEIFGHIRPATTMVEINGFVHPDILVEIEAEAFTNIRSNCFSASTILIL